MTLAASEWSDCSLCIILLPPAWFFIYLYIYLDCRTNCNKSRDCVVILAVINELFSFTSVQKRRLPDKEKAVKIPSFLSVDFAVIQGNCGGLNVVIVNTSNEKTRKVCLVFFLCATELHCCPKTIKDTLSHAIALVDVLLFCSLLTNSFYPCVYFVLQDTYWFHHAI